MYLYTINIAKTTNNISSSTIKQVWNKSFELSIKPTSLRYSYQRNINSDINDKILNNSKITNSTSKNVRLTLTPQAIRQNKFNTFSGKFDTGFPINNNYVLCPQRLSSVFTYGINQFTAFRNAQESGAPAAQVLGLVKDLIIGLGCGENNCYYDPTSGECVPNPPVCIPTEPTQTAIPPNLKTTIKGYAFYVDYIREVNIPNVGNMMVTCAGGHICCRTDFSPSIFTTEGVYAGNFFSMNNLGSCSTNNIQVPGFVPSSPYEVAAAFTIDIPNINNEINTALFALNCETPQGCHNGVTMIFLVAEDANTDESHVIFSSCVAVGCASPVPIGTTTPPDEPAVICIPEEETPSLNCKDVRLVTLGCSLSLENIDPADGTMGIIDYINFIINNERIIPGNFGSSSIFNATVELPPVVIPGAIPISVIITVTRTPEFTYVSYNFFSSVFINNNPQIFAIGFNVPTTSINPYARVSSQPTVISGWLLSYYANILDNCENIELVLNN